MADDFRLTAAEARLKVLNAARQRAVADLAEYEAIGDEAGAGVEIGAIANLDAEAANIANLAQRHVAHNQPPPPSDPDAWKSKKQEEMTHEDVWRMLNETSETAKLGGGISAETYQQQINRLQREKSRGNYTGKP
jgi:hypothetical protein